MQKSWVQQLNSIVSVQCQGVECLVTFRLIRKHERGLKVTKLFSAYNTFQVSKFTLWDCWNNFFHLSISRLWRLLHHLPSFIILTLVPSSIFHFSQSWRDEQTSWIFHLWHSWTRAYKVPSVIFKIRKPTKRMNLQLYNNLNSENNVSQIKDKYN